jgi:hypothetical protein
MLFFQIVLFLGYAYAHGVTRLPRRAQWAIHSALIVGAVAMLPIAPNASWKPTGNEEPVGRILLLLLANVALPYFVLSSTSPLVQVWFSRADRTGSPWRLYALSNIGSFVALLSYPVLIEPRLDVMQQTTTWCWAFGAFALLSLASAYLDWKKAPSQAEEETAAVHAADVRPTWWKRFLWVFLPATASVILLATTNHICQDVAVIPFLWVAPLGLYLITFIICFEHERWYRPLAWALVAIPLVLLASGYKELPFNAINESEFARSICHLLRLEGTPKELLKSYWAQLGICLSAMFLCCMIAHGELTRLKPSSKYLTEFYLLMSAGGAIGGLLVSLLAPKVFSTFVEWPVGLLVCYVIAVLIVVRVMLGLRHKGARIGLSAATALLGVSMIPSLLEWGLSERPRVERVRNFYGAISVEKFWNEDKDCFQLKFHHGGIVHGTQFLTPELQQSPVSYWTASLTKRMHVSVWLGWEPPRRPLMARRGITSVSTKSTRTSSASR